MTVEVSWKTVSEGGADFQKADITIILLQKLPLLAQPPQKRADQIICRAASTQSLFKPQQWR